MIPTIAEHSVLISLPLRGDTGDLERGEIYSFTARSWTRR